MKGVVVVVVLMVVVVIEEIHFLLVHLQKEEFLRISVNF